MAKLRNVSADTLELRVLSKVVAPDEVIDVPDEVYEAHSWAETVWAVVSTRRPTKDEEKT